VNFVKKVLVLFLRFGISIFLLILLFKFNKIEINELVVDIKSADKLLLIFGFFVFFLVHFLGFLRWFMLLRAAGIHIPVKRLIISFSGGAFFSIFLPSTIGGDLVRTADLAGHTKKTKEVIATVFMDRLSGYIGLVIVVIIALIFGRGLVMDRVVITSVAVIIGILLFIVFVLFNVPIFNMISGFLSAPEAGKIREMIRGLHYEIHVFRSRRTIDFYSILLSVLIQLAGPVSAYFIALALGVGVDFVYFLIFLPIIGAITLLPVAIGGLGLRESLFVVYFAKAQVAEQLAIAMSLLSFSFIVFYGAMGGLIYVLAVHYRRVQCDASPKIHKSHT
jgi:hypothetical protein